MHKNNKIKSRQIQKKLANCRIAVGPSTMYMYTVGLAIIK